MSTTYHTAITTGAAANAATINAPLGTLDAAVLAVNTELGSNPSGSYSTVVARLDAIALTSGNAATLANGAALAAQKVIVVDSTTGFLAGAPISYTLVGGVVESNTIATIDSPTQMTCTTNLGAGGIANDTYIAVQNFLGDVEAQRLTVPVLRPPADSTTALQLQNAGGTAILTIDTTSSYVGINCTPLNTLHVHSGSYYTVVKIEGTLGGGGEHSPSIVFKDDRGASYAGAEIMAYRDGVNGGHALIFWNTADNAAEIAGTLTERMRITRAGNVGINDSAPAEVLDVNGNINATGVIKVDDVQVVGPRVVDARCADVANSGDATTDGLIDALRDAMIAHGLIAAA